MATIGYKWLEINANNLRDMQQEHGDYQNCHETTTKTCKTSAKRHISGCNQHNCEAITDVGVVESLLT